MPVCPSRPSPGHQRVDSIYGACCHLNQASLFGPCRLSLADIATILSGPWFILRLPSDISGFLLRAQQRSGATLEPVFGARISSLRVETEKKPAPN